MSCSNKYDKLVQFINTHHQFHANLGQFVLGDRQQYESEAVWRFICDMKDYIDNLDQGKEESNVLQFPRERPHLDLIGDIGYGNTASMDYISFDEDLDLGFSSINAELPPVNMYAADSVSIDWGTGQDHISFDVEEDSGDK